MFTEDELTMHLNTMQAKAILATLEKRFENVKVEALSGVISIPDYGDDLLKRHMACIEIVLDRAMTMNDIADSLGGISPTNLYNPAKALAQMGYIHQLTIRRDRKLLYCAVGQMNFLGKLLGIEVTDKSIREIRHITKRHEKAAEAGYKPRARTLLEKSLKDPILKDIIEDFQAKHGVNPEIDVMFTLQSGDTAATKVIVPFKKATTGEVTMVPLEGIPVGLAQFAEQAKKAIQQIADALAYLYLRDLMLFGIPRERNSKGEFVYSPQPGFKPESQMSNPVAPVDMHKGVRMQPNRRELKKFLETRKAFFEEMAVFIDRLIGLPCWDQEGLDDLDPVVSASADPTVLNKVNRKFLPMSFLMGTNPIFHTSNTFMEMSDRFQLEYLEHAQSIMLAEAAKMAVSQTESAPELDADAEM